MHDPTQIESWQSRQFMDCSRDELKDLLIQLGQWPGSGNHSDEKLRELACKAFGVPFAPKAPSNEPVVTTSAPQKISLRQHGANWFRFMPKLRCEPGWQGRRRMVELAVSERLPEGCMAIIGVNGWDIGIQPGMQGSIPYPHYLALKNTTVPTSRRDAQYNPQTGQHEFKTITIHQPTYPFQDLGDDPSTAGKPLDAIDWLQQQARSRSYFSEESRETMIAILNYLTDNSINRDRMREYSNVDLAVEVLQRIGLYDEALQAEIAAEEAAA